MRGWRPSRVTRARSIALIGSIRAHTAATASALQLETAEDTGATTDVLLHCPTGAPAGLWRACRVASSRAARARSSALIVSTQAHLAAPASALQLSAAGGIGNGRGHVAAPPDRDVSGTWAHRPRRTSGEASRARSNALIFSAQGHPAAPNPALRAGRGAGTPGTTTDVLLHRLGGADGTRAQPSRAARARSIALIVTVRARTMPPAAALREQMSGDIGGAGGSAAAPLRGCTTRADGTCTCAPAALHEPARMRYSKTTGRSSRFLCLHHAGSGVGTSGAAARVLRLHRPGSARGTCAFRPSHVTRARLNALLIPIWSHTAPPASALQHEATGGIGPCRGRIGEARATTRHPNMGVAATSRVVCLTSPIKCTRRRC